MNCEQTRELLSQLLDEELPDDTRASVMDHVAACPECMKVYEAFSVLSDSLKTMEDVPEGFTNDVMRKIKTKRAAPKRRRYLAGALSFAACLALVFLAGRGLHLPDSGENNMARNTETSSDLPYDSYDGAVPEAADENGLIEAQLMSFDTATVYQNALSEEAEEGAPQINASLAGAGEEQPKQCEFQTRSKNALTSNTVAPETLDSILAVSAPAEPGNHDGTADYTIVFCRDEEAYTLDIWIDGERLYCQNAEGNAYYAEGTYAQLLSVMEE